MTAGEEIIHKCASNIAKEILDYHSKNPVNELNHFASQAVEDYKEKLKGELGPLCKEAKQLEFSPHGMEAMFLKLIDSIKA